MLDKPGSKCFILQIRVIKLCKENKGKAGNGLAEYGTVSVYQMDEEGKIELIHSVF